MMNNLHVTMSSFRFGSRILKETSSLVQSGLVRNVYIVALHDEGLAEREMIDDNREVRRISLKSRKWPRNLIVQFVKYVEFCVRVVLFCHGKKIAVVNIHNLALLPLGVFLKWTGGAKLVYDAHELETETFGLCGFRQSAARLIERIFIGYADLNIVVGESINKWYRRKYGLSNIVTVLNCPEYHEPTHSGRLHYELGIPSGKKIAIYQGGLVEGRGIEQLLKAFADFDDGNHVLVLMGYGELEPLIQGYAEKFRNIYFKPAVAPSELLLYTASADYGISFIDNPSLNDRLCLPNKLFEYIMGGLPVIVNDAPEMRRLVTENDVGTVLSELTAPNLKKAFDRLASRDSGELSDNLKRTSRMCSWEMQSELMISAYRRFIFSDSGLTASEL